MKALTFTLALLCLYMGNISAQDRLLLKTGDELYVKVEKVDAATITYTQPPDSMVHTINKADVFMLKFANGTKYVMDNAKPEEVNRQEIEEAIKQKTAIGNYERHKKGYTRRKVSGIALLSIGGAFAAIGIPLICEGIRIDRRDYAHFQNLYGFSYGGWYPQTGMWMTVGGTVLTAVSFAPLLIGTINMSLTPRYKRKMNEAKQQLSFSPTIQPILPAGNIGGSYTGLAMRINF